MGIVVSLTVFIMFSVMHVAVAWIRSNLVPGLDDRLYTFFTIGLDVLGYLGTLITMGLFTYRSIVDVGKEFGFFQKKTRQKRPGSQRPSGTQGGLPKSKGHQRSRK